MSPWPRSRTWYGERYVDGPINPCPRLLIVEHRCWTSSIWSGAPWIERIPMVVSAVSSAQSVARASGTGKSCSIVYMPPRTSAESSPMLWPKLSRAWWTGIVEKLFEQPDLGQLHADDRADIVDEGVERGRFTRQDPGREVDLFPEHVAAQYRCRIEGGRGRPVQTRDAPEARGRAPGLSGHSRETPARPSRSAS